MLNEKKAARYFDAAEEPLQKMLAPIDGYQSYTLVSLDQAVGPVADRINDVDSRVWVALENCQKPPDLLLPDESAAIHLYTMEWIPSENSLYAILNHALRAENRILLRPWFSYLKLLLTALYKLPSVNRTLWRGVRSDLSDTYPIGKKLVWWGFSSCTESIQTLESPQFLGKTDARTLFSIECIHGKSIRAHSYYPDENEYLLLPGTYLQVMGQLNQGNGLTIIHLAQIEPPHDLVKPPFSISHQPRSNSIIKQPEQTMSVFKGLPNDRQFAIDALNAHNKYRRWHREHPLVLSEHLSKQATAWAAHLAEIGYLEEFKDERFGVNSTFVLDSTTTGEQFTRMLFEPLNAFYREKWEKLSDLERSRQDVPQVNVDQLKNYGTATQVLAKLAKQVGFGRATGLGDIGSAGVYLVAVYDVRDKETSIMEKDGWLEWVKDAKMSTSRLRSTLSVLCTIS